MPRTQRATVVPLSKSTPSPGPIAPSSPTPRRRAGRGRGPYRRDRRRDLVDRRHPPDGHRRDPRRCPARLGNKLDLGVHTEMFSDGLMPLLEGGVVTNRFKEVHPGAPSRASSWAPRACSTSSTTTSLVEFHPCDRTNDTSLIRKNENVTAINSASRSTSPARSARTRSATGSTRASAGRWTSSARRRCRRAASRSSRCHRRQLAGRSRASCRSLKPGAGVVTTRGHVHWVVTEYGAVTCTG
jgi:4-hydroxybutyrate CoA-transferase